VRLCSAGAIATHLIRFLAFKKAALLPVKQLFCCLTFGGFFQSDIMGASIRYHIFITLRIFPKACQGVQGDDKIFIDIADYFMQTNIVLKSQD
jgi:hypothetical protein